MCRLAAFPPMFPRAQAEEILAGFARYNRDGTGSVYLDSGGDFKVNKWPLPLKTVLYRDYPLLDHMPHNGWTVVHLRAASHGESTYENTHPFVKGPNGESWAVVHNGIWSEYDLVKAALKGLVKFDGETDSEVAAHLFQAVGPKKFAKLVDFGGVFLGLHQKTGDLWAVSTGGDLEITTTKWGSLVASRLTDYEAPLDLREGWYHFTAKGKLEKWGKTRPAFRPAWGRPAWGIMRRMPEVEEAEAEEEVKKARGWGVPEPRTPYDPDPRELRSEAPLFHQPRSPGGPPRHHPW